MTEANTELLRKKISSMQEELDKLQSSHARSQALTPSAILEAEFGGRNGKNSLSTLKADRKLKEERIEDLIIAIREAENRLSAAEENKLLLKRTEAAHRASKLRLERIQSAAEVDQILGDLEWALVSYLKLGEELTAQLRLAGMDRVGEVSRRLTVRSLQYLRWASWHKAPSASGALEVPFARADRRQNLEDFEKSLIEDPLDQINRKDDKQ